LYVLECAVLSYCRGRNVDDDDALHRGDDDDDVRALASHRPTASYLLMWSDNRRRRSSRRGWEKAAGSTIDRATTIPFQCGRHRYVARLIARECTPSELLEDITRGIVVDEGGEDEDDMGEERGR
jgi:hypothetical protein